MLLSVTFAYVGQVRAVGEILEEGSMPLIPCSPSLRLGLRAAVWTYVVEHARLRCTISSIVGRNAVAPVSGSDVINSRLEQVITPKRAV
jgi:hypothetical protein